MTLTNQNKKDIMDAFIATFTRFADKEYQKRVWIRGEGPECDDLTEASCQLSEVGDPVLEDYKNFHITDQQYYLIKNFMDELDSFYYGPVQMNHSPKEFIDTPEWDNITKLAQEVLIAFNYQKDSRSFS